MINNWRKSTRKHSYLSLLPIPSPPTMYISNLCISIFQIIIFMYFSKYQQINNKMFIFQNIIFLHQSVHSLQRLIWVSMFAIALGPLKKKIKFKNIILLSYIPSAYANIIFFKFLCTFFFKFLISWRNRLLKKCQ